MKLKLAGSSVFVQLLRDPEKAIWQQLLYEFGMDLHGQIPNLNKLLL